MQEKIFGDEDSLRREECSGQSSLISGGQILVASLVEHLARENSGGPGLNPCMVHCIFSLPVPVWCPARGKKNLGCESLRKKTNLRRKTLKIKCNYQVGSQDQECSVQ